MKQDMFYFTTNHSSENHQVHEKDGSLPASNDELSQIVSQLWDGVDLLSPMNMMEPDMDDIDGTLGKTDLADYPPDMEPAEEGDEFDILKKACINVSKVNCPIKCTDLGTKNVEALGCDII